ncbi:MAG: hypothetical protein JNL60_08435 [Bacteroidia bacterium]|nr:hypothetical protein [Bacteroidia bacterium]
MKNNIALALTIIVCNCMAQNPDSLKLKAPVPAKSSEIGVSVSTAFFVLAGVSDYNERFTNVTYRRLYPKHHALKLFTGVALFNSHENNYQQGYYIPGTPHTTIYPTSEITTPSNFQVGVGYEYIIGKKKLKQAFGFDLVYNNKFERNKFYYLKLHDSTGTGATEPTRLDTGAYVKGTNFDKFGFNISYSLRYQFSKRWVGTVSCIGSYRFYKRRENGIESTISDFNMTGLISDISIFYKF